MPEYMVTKLYQVIKQSVKLAKCHANMDLFIYACTMVVNS